MRNQLDTPTGDDVTAGTTATPRRPRARAVAGLLPGLLLCLGGTTAAMGIHLVLPTVSPLLVAILLGAVLANLVDMPRRMRPGLSFSAKKVLRVGIALLGLQLLLTDIFGLGWEILLLVVAIVFLGIAGTVYVGKLLGLTWTQRILIACGFSICGAAAVAAVDGVLDAEEEEVLTAVALVVVFGTVMIPVVPVAAQLLGLSETEAGSWAGGAVHEVAQVVAAGGAIGGAALGVAVVVKLARVLMLAPIIAALGLRQRMLAGRGHGTKRPPLVPLFVLGFLACAGLRSTGLLSSDLLDGAKQAQTAVLTAAMFALGTGIHIVTIKKLGLRPFVLAAFSTLWVAGIALTGILLADTDTVAAEAAGTDCSGGARTCVVTSATGP